MQHRTRNDTQLNLILAHLTQLIFQPQTQVEELNEGDRIPTPAMVEQAVTSEDNERSKTHSLAHESRNFSKVPADATVAKQVVTKIFPSLTQSSPRRCRFRGRTG